jgi:hypothetical protein
LTLRGKRNQSTPTQRKGRIEHGLGQGTEWIDRCQLSNAKGGPWNARFPAFTDIKQEGDFARAC